MTVRWLLAAVHLLALGIGLGAIVVRGGALRGKLDNESVQRVLHADTWWGIAALLWISTGVTRAFFGFEKGTAFYLGSAAFWTKMAFLLIILVLEIGPASTFVQWRIRSRRSEAIDTRRARLYSRTSFIQAGLVVLMVFAATAIARGLFH